MASRSAFAVAVITTLMRLGGSQRLGCAAPGAPLVEVLQLQSPAGPITYTVGSAPSAIWRGRGLMRCGLAFGLHGEPSAGAAQNRVLLDGLRDPGLAATAEPDGLLHLKLQQEFQPSGGGTQRIETQVLVAADW